MEVQFTKGVSPGVWKILKVCCLIGGFYLELELILASSSPRRQELLRQIGLRFAVVPSRLEEKTAERNPAKKVKALALAKANEVAERMGHGLVLGADTIVVIGGKILGKPGSGTEAAAMLRSLSGRAHRVYTGIALVDAATGRSRAATECTLVQFRSLSEREIQAYVASGEPLDKAGAYGIQGHAAVFVSGIKGCYSNVVGLPLSRFWQMLQDFSGTGLPS